MFGLFLFVSAAVAAPSSGGCGFYLDLEKRLHCAEKTNYLTSYGYPYCEKFQSNMKHWTSGPLKRWVPKTSHCLQESLNETPCDSLAARALQTHSTCYAQGGFCRLGYRDRQRILNVISWMDVTKAAEQVFKLKSTCGIGLSSTAVHLFDSMFGVTRALDFAKTKLGR